MGLVAIALWCVVWLCLSDATDDTAPMQFIGSVALFVAVPYSLWLAFQIFP